jgi:Bacterial protein of unknown function (DUF899)
MTKHMTGTRKEWLAARLKLLEAEKELTRRSDELARRQQELPWVRIDKEYRFETDEGSASLADLFRGRSQLLVYHFMLGPDYTAGCPSCSAIADGFNGFAVHLANHDVTLSAVSRESKVTTRRRSLARRRKSSSSSRQDPIDSATASSAWNETSSLLDVPGGGLPGVSTSPRTGFMIGVGMPSIIFRVGSAYRAAIMGDCAGLVEWGRGGRRAERQGFRCVDLGEKGPGSN